MVTKPNKNLELINFIIQLKILKYLLKNKNHFTVKILRNKKQDINKEKRKNKKKEKRKNKKKEKRKDKIKKNKIGDIIMMKIVGEMKKNFSEILINV